MTRPDSQAEREALAADHARAWMEVYGIRTAPYTRDGGDHPMMDTLPTAMLAFADALRSRLPSEEEIALHESHYAAARSSWLRQAEDLIAQRDAAEARARDLEEEVAHLREHNAVLRDEAFHACRAAAVVTEAGDG